ncbi:hypothetical protein F511_36677 [Dorcoceras hygrometricum]|uniref:BZIP domain-containing protein n=1 Tax=Dorcoceras hygrometricum TaxID=472368 RepID=A0A2Z7BFZ4_9LAMI|nr:hypothetical protein F511_36677 [Dorcoceras hygrometricum]
MANSKGPSTNISMLYNGKNTLLPPKSPLPSISPAYTEYIPISAAESKVLPQPRESNSHPQRTSSESVLMDEQPSWLDDLLNEPETPVFIGGHHRSSSDSFAYIDTTHVRSMDYIGHDDKKLKILSPLPSWGSQDIDINSDMQLSSFYTDPLSLGVIKNKKWDAPVGLFAPARGHRNLRGNPIVPNAGSLCTLQDAERNSSPSTEKQDPVETGPQDPKCAYETKDASQAKSSSLETDTKRAKQQFAQRSRVRKLQYIAELESNVQALEAQISVLFAELEFQNQKFLILSMENTALKKRLESLAQEQFIQCLEVEMLNRECGRLRSLRQQQTSLPQQQQLSSSHQRAGIKDFGQLYFGLSLKIKEPSPGRDSIPGQRRN